MEAKETMEKAISIVEGHATDRDIGKERSMKRIVAVFNRLTGHTLSELDGDTFMVCLKLVRMQINPNEPDNYVDAIGYIGMASETIEVKS